jgi:hypothetical protein
MGSSPKPPDPYAQAGAQQQAELGASQASAIINNPNQYTPWGSRVTTQNGWETVYDASGHALQVPRYNETTRLSPDQQRLLGLQTQSQYNLGQTAVEQSAKLRQHLGKGVDTAGLQGWERGAAPGEVRQDTAPTDRRALEAAMMGRWNEDAARQNAAQDAQLAARGMAPGSQGWGDVASAQARARTDAVNQAYLASGQESRAAQEAYNQAEQQRYQEGQDYASAGNQLRQAQLQERLALRNQPINEITSLLGGSQVTMPSFLPFSRQGVNAAPIGSYIGQNYANQAQAYGQQMAGLFGLGSAGITGLLGLPAFGG